MTQGRDVTELPSEHTTHAHCNDTHFGHIGGYHFFCTEGTLPHPLCMYVDVYVQVCMHLIRISYIFIFPIRYFLFIKNYRNTTSV